MSESRVVLLTTFLENIWLCSGFTVLDTHLLPVCYQLPGISTLRNIDFNVSYSQIGMDGESGVSDISAFLQELFYTTFSPLSMSHGGPNSPNVLGSNGMLLYRKPSNKWSHIQQSSHFTRSNYCQRYTMVG